MAYVTAQGGLRVKLLTPVECGPPAVTEDQTGWVLDVTVDSGDGRDWNKLLNTPLVRMLWPQLQQLPCHLAHSTGNLHMQMQPLSLFTTTHIQKTVLG